jgi:hypothetical protein
MGQIGTASGDVNERSGGVSDCGFGVGIFFGEGERKTEGECEEGGE